MVLLLLRKFCRNFLFVFWPTLASIREYPKYLGSDPSRLPPEPPPPDPLIILCLKLIFGVIFDAIQVGLAIVIVWWALCSFCRAAFLETLFYLKIHIYSMFVYLILTAIGALVGYAYGLLTLDPGPYRSRNYRRKAHAKNDDDNPIRTISKEEEEYYSDLRKEMHRIKAATRNENYGKKASQFWDMDDTPGWELADFLKATQWEHLNPIYYTPPPRIPSAEVDHNGNFLDAAFLFDEIDKLRTEICQNSEDCPCTALKSQMEQLKNSRKRTRHKNAISLPVDPTAPPDNRVPRTMSHYHIHEHYYRNGEKMSEANIPEFRTGTRVVQKTGEPKVHPIIRFLNKYYGYQQQFRDLQKQRQQEPIRRNHFVNLLSIRGYKEQREKQQQQMNRNLTTSAPNASETQ